MNPIDEVTTGMMVTMTDVQDLQNVIVTPANRINGKQNNYEILV
jgi:hypothetical protein